MLFRSNQGISEHHIGKAFARRMEHTFVSFNHASNITETALSGSKGRVKISSWSHRHLFEAVPFDGQISNPIPPTFTDDEADFFDPIKK